jgi:predicted glutamine amidotransferase
MCKIMVFTNTEKVRKLERLVNFVAPLITASDNDGFGWVAQGAKGPFGERSILPVHKYRLNKLDLTVALPITKPSYNTFGKRSELTGPMVFHGRTSTNQKGLLNAHPIVKNNWYLVHNGVVSNHGPSYKMSTSNDTEHLVHYLSSSGIQGIESNLGGYYAFGAIDPNGKLHVARDSMARLVTAYVKSIDSYVFATTADLIEETCRHMEWKVGPIDLVEDNLYMVFNKNRLETQTIITPRGSSYRENSYASKSLHYLEDYKSEPKSSGIVNAYPEPDDDGWKTSEYRFALADYLDDIEKRLDANQKLRFYDQFDREIDRAEFESMRDDDRLKCLVTDEAGQCLTPDWIGSLEDVDVVYAGGEDI